MIMDQCRILVESSNVLNEKAWLVETQRPAERTRANGPTDLKPLGNPTLSVADNPETNII